MTEAEGLAVEISAAIRQLSRLQLQLAQYETQIQESLASVLALDLGAGSFFSHSAARVMSTVGNGIDQDAEAISHVKNELRLWLERI